ncbi:TPA: phage holin [Streptococcus suis]
MMSILTVVGVINDPTTNGIADSEQALHYYEPKADKR